MQEEPIPIDTTSLYETLQIKKTATDEEIKTNFRSLARKHHPDRPRVTDNGAMVYSI